MRWVWIAALVPMHASAHGGGLDKHGCHHKRSDGSYHCHRSIAHEPVTVHAVPTKARHTPPAAHPPVPHGERHGCRYTVGAHDTMAGLAKALDVRLEDLVRWNHIEDPNRIEIGTELFLTAECSHEVTMLHESGKAISFDDPFSLSAEWKGFSWATVGSSRASQGRWAMMLFCLDGRMHFGISTQGAVTFSGKQVDLIMDWGDLRTLHAARIGDAGTTFEMDFNPHLKELLSSNRAEVTITVGAESATFQLRGSRRVIGSTQATCKSF